MRADIGLLATTCTLQRGLTRKAPRADRPVARRLRGPSWPTWLRARGCG